MNGLGNATSLSSLPAQPAAATVAAFVATANANSSVVITHTSSQNSTTFTVSSPTKNKQTVFSIAKKSTSPSKFYNNSSLNGMRTMVVSNLNIGASRLHDFGAPTSSSSEEPNAQSRLRKCVVKVTEVDNSHTNSNDRYKLKRLSMNDADCNGGGGDAKRFDDGAVKKSNLTSSKSFCAAGPFQNAVLQGSKKQQLARSNSITSRRSDSSNTGGAGQQQHQNGYYGGQSSESRSNGMSSSSSLESTVSFFNELIFKHLKTTNGAASGQPAAPPAKNHLNLKAKLQEELEKPLKLYAFMSLRHKIHPLFLNRNLSYLKKAHKNSLPNEKSKKMGISATKRRRKQCQIANILPNKLQQQPGRPGLARTQSQELTDEVTFHFERLVTHDDDVVAYLAEMAGSELVMDSYVELYGLKTLSYRSTSDSSSTVVQLVNDPPVLLGKCPIAINDQACVSTVAAIKLSLKNLVGDASFFPYVYFRFVVVFKKPPAPSSQAPRSPRKSTTNGHHHHPAAPAVSEQPTVECFKEYVLVCSLTMTSDPASPKKGAPLVSQQPINLRLDESKNWTVKLEVKQIPKRILFDRPSSDLATRPKFGQLGCWPIYQPLSLARPLLRPSVQSVQPKSSQQRRSRRDYYVADEELVEESEDEASEEEDVVRPSKKSGGKSAKQAASSTNGGGKRAKAPPPPVVKRPSGKRHEHEFNHQNGSAAITDERLEQLIKQSMSQGDFVDLRISVSRSTTVRSRSAVRTEQQSSSPRSLASSHGSPPATVSKMAANGGGGGGKKHGVKNGHGHTANNVNVYYEFYSTKAASESKKHHHHHHHHHLTEMSIGDLPGSLISNLNLKKLICPFCYLLCNHAYNLLQHMLACHPRFQIHLSLASTLGGGGETGASASTFNGSSLVHSASCSSNLVSYQSNGGDGSNGKTTKKIQFEICAESKYDGSYAANPYDLFESAHVGYSQSRLGPSKRVPVTYVLVHKKTGYIDLSRYSDMTPAQIKTLNIRQQQQDHLRTEMQPNNAFNCQDGMERIYYHAKTCMPILADEIDIDSDDELDPDWLKEYTAIQINDFDDVNRGEKDLMLLWNLHVLRSNYIADQQMYQACQDFIDTNIGKLVDMRLTRNFFVHLRSLYDYGLLRVTEMLKLIDYLSAKETELGVTKASPAPDTAIKQAQGNPTSEASGQLQQPQLKSEPTEPAKASGSGLGEFIRKTINKSPLASRLLGLNGAKPAQTPSPSNGVHHHAPPASSSSSPAKKSK